MPLFISVSGGFQDSGLPHGDESLQGHAPDAALVIVLGEHSGAPGLAEACYFALRVGQQIRIVFATHGAERIALVRGHDERLDLLFHVQFKNSTTMPLATTSFAAPVVGDAPVTVRAIGAVSVAPRSKVSGPITVFFVMTVPVPFWVLAPSL